MFKYIIYICIYENIIIKNFKVSYATNMAKLLLIPARRANEGEVFTFISSFEIRLEMRFFYEKVLS